MHRSSVLNVVVPTSSFQDGLVWVEGEGTEHKTLGKVQVQGGPVQWCNGAIKFAANELAHCVLPWTVAGYAILPVDWSGNKHRSFARTLQLDFRKDSTWSFIRRLPGLSENDQARVDSANLIYDNAADFCKWLLQKSPASMLKHPFDVARALPDGMVRALFKVLVEGPVAVIRTRLNLLKLWKSWALELEPAESKLGAGLAPSVRQVLSGKRTLLLQKIAASFDWPDKSLRRDITQGFKLTGYLECTDVFHPDEKPAYSTEQDFWDGAPVLRDSLWEKVASHKVQDYSQALWDITMDEADSQGKGLVAMQTLCRVAGQMEALDEITWACVQIFKCAVARGDVSFTLQDGSILKGKLHSAWRDVDRVRPLSKTYDLKAAYKQMPLHPDERRKAIIILKNPSTLQVQAFVCNTLPFGSSASVLHFNRVSLLLQRVMWELCLISACYYDDFPSAMPAMLSEGSDNIVHTVMQLLGPLGVVLDTSDPALECVQLRNKTEKAEAMSQSLGKILEDGVVSSRELPSMLGRLQFLESQLFGRVGKLALADLRQVEKSSHDTVNLDGTHLDALKLLRARLLASKPRRIVASLSTPPVLLFSDGACEPSGSSFTATIGGVLS
ncbi:PARP6 [Symbiodinium sp. CCMP2456]|nr:PARP6 [Symbiodinium sp. CCMP2456]